MGERRIARFARAFGRTRIAILAAAVALATGCYFFFFRSQPTRLIPGKLAAHSFVLDKGAPLAVVRSLVYLPKTYQPERTDQRWPLVIFLHGSWHRGEDLNLVKVSGLPKLIDGGVDFPFILVAPQCPAEEVWHTDDLSKLITAVEREFNVDSDQIHVIGFELGGYAAWDLAAQTPERFATVVPFGGLASEKSNRTDTAWMNRVHLWPFVSTNDRSTSLGQVRTPIFRAWTAGDSVRLTDVVGDERPLWETWTSAFRNAGVVSWMMEQQRKSSCFIRWAKPPTPGQTATGALWKKSGNGNERSLLDFSVHVPPTTEEATSSPPPLLLLLKDEDVQPTDPTPLDAVESLANPKDVDASQALLVVVPQAVAGKDWDPSSLQLLLEQLDIELSIDPNRRFLVGVGRGAAGAWELAARDPWSVAGMVFVGYRPGPAQKQQANSMAQIPKWFIAYDAATKPGYDYCLLVSRTSNLTGPRPAPRWTDATTAEGQSAVDILSVGQWCNQQPFTQWSTRRNTWPTNILSLDMMASPAVSDLFKQESVRFTGGRYQDQAFPYRLFVPPTTPPKQGFPLVVWLHGHGTGEFQLEAGVLKYMDLVMPDPVSPESYGFCVLAMPCPKDRSWFDKGKNPSDGDEPITILMRAIEAVRRSHPIDADRISLVGISSGANACWELACRRPKFFSAIAPLGSTGADLSRVDTLKGEQIWAFKGLTDEGADDLRSTVRRARELGAGVQLTEVPTPSHYAWTEAFLEHNLLIWLLDQRR